MNHKTVEPGTRVYLRRLLNVYPGNMPVIEAIAREAEKGGAA